MFVLPVKCFNAHAWYCVDYDLQVALMEALCRMTSRAQRRQLADLWFRMEFVASAFNKIQDTEFETVSDHVLMTLLFLNIYKEGPGLTIDIQLNLKLSIRFIH